MAKIHIELEPDEMKEITVLLSKAICDEERSAEELKGVNSEYLEQFIEEHLKRAEMYSDLIDKFYRQRALSVLEQEKKNVTD